MTRAALKHPAVHFLAVGAVIFAAVRWAAPSGSHDPERYSIVISAEQIRDLRARHRSRHGELPSDAETAALVEGAVVDEILYREAVARGLDATDAVVERRLVQDMRFLSDSAGRNDAAMLRQAHALGLRDGDPVIRRRLVQRMRALLAQENAHAAPTEEEVRAYFETNRDTFAAAPSVRLTQVFFSGPHATDKAAAALAELEATRTGPRAAAGYGEPFVAGTDLPMTTERGLAKLFGPDFARASLSLPVGEWSGPLPSARGVHLLWIHERPAAPPPSLASVRDRIRRLLEAERIEKAMREGIAAVRARYRVDVGVPPS